MIETPIYEGAMPGMRTEPQVAKMSDVGMRATQQSIERAAQGIDMMEETYKYMVDYGTHKNAQRLLDDATREYDDGMSKASALAPGTPGSLWNEDYSLNEEMLGQLRREYEQKVEGIQPKFLDSRRGFEFEQQRGSVLEKTLERSEGHAHAMQLKMARQGVEDRVENYALHGNYAAAYGEIDGAVGAGLMSKVQADTAKLKLARPRWERGECEKFDGCADAKPYAAGRGTGGGGWGRPCTRYDGRCTIGEFGGGAAWGWFDAVGGG